MNVYPLGPHERVLLMRKEVYREMVYGVKIEKLIYRETCVMKLVMWSITAYVTYYVIPVN